jgi:hypothetical protein
MVREMDFRRVILTLLLAAWLSVQFLVVALSPSWGFMLPHEHITRGTLSDLAWQEHLREHRLGYMQASEWQCEGLRSQNSNAVIASLPDSVGTISSFALSVASLQNTHVEIPVPNAPCARFTAFQFFALNVSYSPLDPPPNLRAYP